MSVDKVFAQIKHKTSLGKLLFGSYDIWRHSLSGTKKDGERVFARPPLNKVLRIKLLSLKWTVQDFTNLGVSMDEARLQDIRDDISIKIDEWIFSNPHNKRYINDAPTRRVGGYTKTFDKYYLYPEYDLIQWLWLSCAAYMDDPIISFSKMDKLLDYRGLRDKLTTSQSDLDVDKLKAILIKVNKWGGQEAENAISQGSVSLFGIPFSEKLEIYRITMDKISEYMKERDLSFISGKPSSTYYQHVWFDKISRSYHNVFLFARQLGFDPLTFTPLEDSIFKAKVYRRSSGRISWTSDYRRHHLNSDGKDSLFLQDLVLTDIRIHNSWNIISEADARIILDKFSQLIIKDGPISEDDIREIYKGYEWVLDNDRTGWTKNEDFENHLAEFDERKNLYKSPNGLKKLIVDTGYENLYNRFFTCVENDAYRSLILFTKPAKPYGLRDFSDFIAIDWYFSRIKYSTYLFRDI